MKESKDIQIDIKKNENWNDYQSAGALSRYILWSKPTLKESIADYKKKFNLR